MASNSDYVTFEQRLDRERRLTAPQRSFLAELRAHKHWSAGCGWVYTSRAVTVRLAEVLVKQGLATISQLPGGRVEYRPAGDGKVVYLAIGPYGWGKAPTINEAKRICRDSCSRRLRGGEQYDVFVCADHGAYVDDFGRMCSDGSGFVRIAGRGDFMWLNAEVAAKAATSEADIERRLEGAKEIA